MMDVGLLHTVLRQWTLFVKDVLQVQIFIDDDDNDDAFSKTRGSALCFGFKHYISLSER